MISMTTLLMAWSISHRLSDANKPTSFTTVDWLGHRVLLIVDRPYHLGEVLNVYTRSFSELRG